MRLLGDSMLILPWDRYNNAPLYKQNSNVHSGSSGRNDVSSNTTSWPVKWRAQTTDALCCWHDISRYVWKCRPLGPVFYGISDIQGGFKRKEANCSTKDFQTLQEVHHDRTISSQQSSACSSKGSLQSPPQPPTRSGTQNYKLVFCSRTLFDRLLFWQWLEWPSHKFHYGMVTLATQNNTLHWPDVNKQEY